MSKRKVTEPETQDQDKKVKSDESKQSKSRLSGKVCLVTGAGGAIGAEIAAELIRQGASVSIADVNGAKKTEDEIKEKFGTNIVSSQVDISDEKAVQTWVDEAAKHWNGIDVLINCAAVFVFGGVEEVTSEAWSRVLDVNVKGSAFCSKYVVPHMRKRGGGSIINIGSISSHIAQPDFVPYNTSKGAILQMTRCMAVDLGKDNIRVNCLCPGFIDTPATANHAKKLGITKEALIKDALPKHALPRIGTCLDVAYGCVFLASDESTFITGASIMIDGGYTTM
jgi:NAD(P)-dependent dehydrogenase (short-subunit alcohol dehydrogenase family)